MLPVKLMECLALGVPVVAPGLKAIPLLRRGMLFLFEPGDVDSLAGAIEQARDPRERAYRMRSAQAFLDRYNWEHP